MRASRESARASDMHRSHRTFCHRSMFERHHVSWDVVRWAGGTRQAVGRCVTAGVERLRGVRLIGVLNAVGYYHIWTSRRVRCSEVTAAHFVLRVPSSKLPSLHLRYLAVPQYTLLWCYACYTTLAAPAGESRIHGKYLHRDCVTSGIVFAPRMKLSLAYAPTSSAVVYRQVMNKDS